MTDKSVYIYALTEPDNAKAIRYIGKTDNLTLRFNAHLCEMANNPKCHWIQELLAIGLRPQIKVLEILTNPTTEDWGWCEKFWLSFFKEQGCKLTNSTDGGEGGNPSEEARRKQSLAKQIWHPRAKITREIVVQIRELYANGGIKQSQLATMFNIERSSISDIIRGKSWSHITGPITHGKQGREIIPVAAPSYLTDED